MMPITAIFTTSDTTTLTIATAEVVLLEQKDAAQARQLDAGVNQVTVGPGVYRVVSKTGVRVTPAAQDVHLITLNDKTGGPIELSGLLPPGFTGADVSAFLELKSMRLE
jgi:hypothetical protein